MKKHPCTKDCPERSSTCHSTCKKYLDWVKIHRNELEEIRNIKKTKEDLICVCRGYGEYTYYKKKR